MTPRLWLLAWLLAFLAWPALAEPKYPPYTGERVTLLAPTKEDYTPLRNAIRAVEQERMETYFVVVRDAPGATSQERESYAHHFINRWFSSVSNPAIAEFQHMVLVIASNPGPRLNIELGSDLQSRLHLNSLELSRESERRSAALAAHPGETARFLAEVVRSISRRLRQAEAGLPSAQRGDFA